MKPAIFQLKGEGMTCTCSWEIIWGHICLYKISIISLQFSSMARETNGECDVFWYILSDYLLRISAIA